MFRYWSLRDVNLCYNFSTHVVSSPCVCCEFVLRINVGVLCVCKLFVAVRYCYSSNFISCRCFGLAVIVVVAELPLSPFKLAVELA